MAANPISSVNKIVMSAFMILLVCSLSYQPHAIVAILLIINILQEYKIPSMYISAHFSVNNRTEIIK
jgi:hypothetical protein